MEENNGRDVTSMYETCGTIQGCCENNKLQRVLNVTENCNNHETFDISNLWNLESVGIDPEAKHNNGLYEKTMNQIKFVKGLYAVKFPWKNIHEHLNDYTAIAEKQKISAFSKRSLPEDKFCTDARNRAILLKKLYLSQLTVLDARNKTHHGSTSIPVQQYSGTAVLILIGDA
uniref:Uncharacterized protein n=1 Tax=Glossina austeni TaxID=7395 RepID=A0A1A9UQU9_GLOAU